MGKGYAIGLIGALSLAGGAAHAADRPGVLIFSHSTGFRHASIEAGVAAIQALAGREGYDAQASADPAMFAPDRLKRFAAIVLVSTTTDPKDPASEWFVGARRDALQAFVRRGGGIVAIHAAADSHYHWPWYGKLIGGHFARHPKGTPTGTLKVIDREHPATRGLPARFARADEWYYFNDYNPEMRLLVTLDPASIGEDDVNPNPVAWSHAFEGGRVFYTGMGHTPESFADPNVLKHIAGGLRWSIGR